MFDIVATSFIALLTLTNVVLAPREARRVRDGQNARSGIYLWRTKANLALPQQEFRAKYRRALSRTGWPWVVIGVLLLVLNAIPTSGAFDPMLPLANGGMFLLTGLTSLRCMRIIDNAPPPAAVQPSEAQSR